MKFFTSGQYVNHEPPLPMLFKKPDDFFTDQESDVLFCLLQEKNDKDITKELAISEQQFDEKRKIIYRKANVNSFEDFKMFCKKHHYDRYVPQKFLKPSSKIIPFSGWE